MRRISLLAAVIGLAMAGGALALEPLVPEVEGWGMLRGVRAEGQFFPIRTSLRVASPGWAKMAATDGWQVKEARAVVAEGKRSYTGKILLDDAPVQYSQQITTRDGAVIIHIEATATQAMVAEGLYYFISVPAGELAGGTAALAGAERKAAVIPVAKLEGENHFLGGQTDTVELSRGKTRVEVKLGQARGVTVQDDRKWNSDQYSVFFAIHSGNIAAGQKFSADVEVRVETEVDTAPAQVTIYPDRVTHTLDGFGGNMCFGPESPVTLYNIDRLNTAWGRVWAAVHEWEPENDNADVNATDMAKLAANDKPGTKMRTSMEIAQELQKRKIPYIASTWPMPKWLLLKPWEKDPFTHGVQIAPDKWEELAECIGSYLVYAKQKYGVEPDMFSFNEPDWGVTLKLTPEEQRDVIKLLGKHFAKLGLKTKLLLGDVTNARGTAKYCDPTIADAEAMRYVQAIAFHSWGGATPQQYGEWHERAVKANRPLLCTEAGVDAQAWRYGGVFNEYWYGMGEAKQYQELLRYARPQGILLWEYTEDYGFVNVDKSKTPPVLTPTKRFYLLRQFATSTPRNAQGLEVESSRKDLLATAFRGRDGKMAVHLMNDGAAREVEIRGLAAGAYTMDVTDSSRDGATSSPDVVEKGALRVKVPAWSLVSVRQR